MFELITKYLFMCPLNALQDTNKLPMNGIEKLKDFLMLL